jgi:hypothetical protein
MVSSFNSLYPLLIPDVGNDDTLMRQHLLQAARSFCRDTESWLKKITMTIAANQAPYILTPGALDATIIRPYRVWDAGDDTLDPIATSAYRFDPSTRTLTFEATPTVGLANGLIAQVVLLPSITASDLETWFMERWAEGIVAGAKSSLFAMSRKSWSNQERSEYWKREYDRIKALAVVDKWKESLAADTTMETMPWCP